MWPGSQEKRQPWSFSPGNPTSETTLSTKASARKPARCLVLLFGISCPLCTRRHRQRLSKPAWCDTRVRRTQGKHLHPRAGRSSEPLGGSQALQEVRLRDHLDLMSGREELLRLSLLAALAGARPKTATVLGSDHEDIRGLRHTRERSSTNFGDMTPCLLARHDPQGAGEAHRAAVEGTVG